MNARVVAVGLGALMVLGTAACSSTSGTGAAPATTIKLGTPSYQTLVPVVTSTLPPATTPGQGGAIVPGEQSYTVVSGDILVRIAKTYCITAQQIVDYNAWTDGFKHNLFPGDIVKIPANACEPGTAATTPPAAAAATPPQETTTTFDASLGGTYVVQSGDYLSGIAAKTGTTVDGILAANGWTDGPTHSIFPGQKIKLPAKTG